MPGFWHAKRKYLMILLNGINRFQKAQKSRQKSNTINGSPMTFLGIPISGDKRNIR